MLNQIKTIIPLGVFRARAGDSLLYFLQCYGVGVEDILLEAIRAVLISEYPIPYERFEHYLDTAGLDVGYEAVELGTGKPGASLFDVTNKFVDAVYLMYTTNFHFLRAAFGYIPSDTMQYEVGYNEAPMYLGEDMIVAVGIFSENDHMPYERRYG